MLKTSILRLPNGLGTPELLETIMEDARSHFHHSRAEFDKLYPDQEADRFTFEIRVEKIKE